MPIGQFAHHSQHRDRHFLKDPLGSRHHIFFFPPKSHFWDIVSIVLQSFDLGAPPVFKLIQTAIIRFAAPHIKICKPMLTIPSDRLPHHQVVGSYAQVVTPGGTIFVHRLAAEMEKDRPGNGPSGMMGQDHKALFLRQYMLVNTPKEVKWLRWNAMMFAGDAVEAIELFHRADIICYLYVNLALLGFFDISPGTASESFQKPVGILLQIKMVKMIGG